MSRRALFERFKRLPIVGSRDHNPGNPGLLCGYDLDANRILLPEHVRQMRPKPRKAWMEANGIVPAIGGGGFSMLQMLEPFMVTDAVAVTAAAETVLTQDTILTLPGNYFSFVGKKVWMRAMGKQSNVVTTPGTYTFRLRYNAIGGTVLVASGAIAPNPVAVTDNLWYVDLWIDCLAQGQTTTSLTLLAYGEMFMANTNAAAADIRNASMPPGGTSLANVASLDGSVPKALTLTTQPTVATGSITCRDAWIVALN